MHKNMIFGLLSAGLIFVGGLGTAYGDDPKSNACALFTVAELSAAVNTPIDAGQNFSRFICKWSRTGGSGDAAVKASAGLMTLSAFQRFQAYDHIPVTGIGDEAFYRVGSWGVALYVRKGNTAFSLTLTDAGLSEAQLMAREKVLALKAVSRL